MYLEFVLLLDIVLIVCSFISWAVYNQPGSIKTTLNKYCAIGFSVLCVLFCSWFYVSATTDKIVDYEIECKIHSLDGTQYIQYVPEGDSCPTIVNVNSEFKRTFSETTDVVKVIFYSEGPYCGLYCCFCENYEAVIGESSDEQ